MLKKLAAFFWNENSIALLLSAISFCVYLTTMCRSVGFTDSGELAAVICTLGIAHPTGYPLFTLLGRCLVMIPCPLEEIIRLNIFTSFLTAIAVGIFFKTTIVLRRSASVFPPKRLKQKEMDTHRWIIASALASLVLGFSTTFWSQSTAIEVYALHLVLVLLTIMMFVVGLEEQSVERVSISRKLIFFAFILGLSFSNHMTTVLLAPAFVWLYVRVIGFNKNSLKIIFRIAPFFLLGLSTYLYLPIRSAGNPLFDWGHPATLESFFWHVSGKQFRVWMFSSWNVVEKQLNYFINNFISEFNVIIVGWIIAGLFILFKRSRRLVAFLVWLFGATILYAVNYDIFDIDSYFLLSYIVVGFMVAFGLDVVMEWIKNKGWWIKIILMALMCALPIIQIIGNREKVDETRNNIPQQFVEKSFSDLEPHALVLASEWDYFLSPSLYYQFIRQERCDVAIVDNSLLQNHSWYFLQLERNAPWLMERIRPRANLFLMELNKFEHGLPFTFSTIQARWQNLLSDIVEQSLPDHPVYIDVRLDQEFSPEYHRTPAGLFLRLTKEEDPLCYRSTITPFVFLKTDQPVAQDFTRYYCTILMRDVYWLAKQGEKDRAKKVLTEVLHRDPGNFEANWFVKQAWKE